MSVIGPGQNLSKDWKKGSPLFHNYANHHTERFVHYAVRVSTFASVLCLLFPTVNLELSSEKIAWLQQQPRLKGMSGKKDDEKMFLIIESVRKQTVSIA